MRVHDKIDFVRCNLRSSCLFITSLFWLIYIYIYICVCVCVCVCVHRFLFNIHCCYKATVAFLWDLAL